MRLALDLNSPEDYSTFLKVKALPQYRFIGRTAEFPDEYAGRLGIGRAETPDAIYEPLPGLFDYQAAIAALAIRKRKFAAFVKPGLGKTLIEYEFARHALNCLPAERCALIVTPLMVVPQMLEEAGRFYGNALPVEQVKAAQLDSWLASGSSRLGVTNWEALRDGLRPGRLGALIADESSMLKSFYGKWGQVLLDLGRGLEWKLAGTGTPAPNDRIEYANHAVFLDHFPTVNSFLARFFVNRGETQNRWELKPHALRPFYRALSHWCVFLNSPATYGWKDNCHTIPPVNVHIEDVELSEGQWAAARDVTGDLFGMYAGGIGGRQKLARIAKGDGGKLDSRKPAFIRRLIDSWPEESTIVWCYHNAEQDELEKTFPEAASIRGSTKVEDRIRLLSEFKSGARRVLISKPDVLGFGLNLQIATRQIFNGLRDSYEEFFQAVHRSNRVGSTKPLNVHIPITAIERPMVETVLAKARRVDADAAEQERMFKGNGDINVAV
jgi:hypothetical protein